jgi:hypothetical protein
MKLRKAIKLAAAGTMFGMTTAAMAVPSVGNFTTDSSDTISATCPSGYTCAATPITDAGFFQRVLTETATGRKFIQNILTEGVTTDGGVTFAGDSGFSDENFVEMGGTGGIISRQSLAESDGIETFKSTAVNNAGAFRVSDQVGIQIDQSVVENALNGETMSTTFQLLEMDEAAKGGNVTAQTTITGAVGSGEFSGDFTMVTYVVEDTTGTYTSADYKKIDVNATLLGDVEQTVSLRERTGASVLAGSMTPDAGSNGSWSNSDTVINLIISQTTAGAGVFGLNDFANETTGGANGIDSFSDANAAAFQVPATTGADPFADIVL